LLRVSVQPDEELECPSDWGGWKLYSFSTRHGSYKHPSDLGFEGSFGDMSIGLRRKLTKGTAFLLSYYEHSGCIWMVKNGHVPAGVEFQWDGTLNAGLLVWAQPVANLGAKTYEARFKDAENFCQAYTDWANGYGFWFAVEDEDGEWVDSCGGFLGDPATSGLAEAVAEAIGDSEYEVVGDDYGYLTHDIDAAVKRYRAKAVSA